MARGKGPGTGFLADDDGLNEFNERPAAAEESLGDKKEPVTLDRVQPDPLNGRAAVLFSLQSQEIIPSR